MHGCASTTPDWYTVIRPPYIRSSGYLCIVPRGACCCWCRCMHGKSEATEGLVLAILAQLQMALCRCDGMCLRVHLWVVQREASELLLKRRYGALSTCRDHSFVALCQLPPCLHTACYESNLLTWSQPAQQHAALRRDE